jgi:hypothetical protein
LTSLPTGLDNPGMDDVAKLLARMRELEPQVHLSAPAPEEAIQELEAAFGRPMPPSYRAFLARFGGFSILASPYSGIVDGKVDDGMGCAWTDTQVAREDCQLPKHYLVVQPDEDGYTCLDFSRTGSGGEHPVVYHMPFRETPFHEVAESYRAWLGEDLESMIEAWLEAP